MRITRRLAAAGSAALASVGCTPLAFFDAVAPRDGGTVKAGRSLPYGPLPRQTLDIHVPANLQAGAGAPVVVFFYGGSWTSGSKEEYDFVGAALAAQGFVAVLPDYRLFPNVSYTDFLDDCAKAVAYARANVAGYGGDGGRIVLAGHSAGAYNAAMLALDGRYLARTGVPRSAIRGLVGLSGPYDFLPLEPGTAQDVFGRAPDKRATQPITFAGPGSPPAYLATGTDDTIVRPKNTISLAAKLRAAGVPVVERLYPGLDHKDTLLALSVLFRGRAPILAEVTSFVRQVSGSAG